MIFKQVLWTLPLSAIGQQIVGSAPDSRHWLLCQSDQNSRSKTAIFDILTLINWHCLKLKRSKRFSTSLVQNDILDVTNVLLGSGIFAWCLVQREVLGIPQPFSFTSTAMEHMFLLAAVEVLRETKTLIPFFILSISPRCIFTFSHFCVWSIALRGPPTDLNVLRAQENTSTVAQLFKTFLLDYEHLDFWSK